MDLLDHQKTWHFSVTTDYERCLQAFQKFSINFGFTTDARFFRSSIHDVEKQLYTLNPVLTVDKS